MRYINTILLLLCFQFLKAQTLSETQLRNARATGYAIIAAKNPGISFSVLVIPWDGVNTLEYNANVQINPGWHAQAAIKGNFFYQAFDGSDFSTYSSVITSQDEFDLYKSTGTQWWIVCSTLSPFAATIKKNGLEDVVIGQTNPIYLSNVWRGYPDAVTNVAEISNDVSAYKQLMIVGNRAQNQDRRVGIWDRLSVSGAPFSQQFNVGGNAYVQGSLGIGIDNPSAKLHVAGDNASIKITGGTQTSLEFLDGGTNDPGYVRTYYYGQMESQIGAYGTYFALQGGNVGIGTSNATEKLSVNGNVKAKKLIVTQSGWPDYVFAPQYQLKPLSAVESFIKKFKHLPDIPSEKEVAEQGLDVGQTQALLLKKIEELTLHVIRIEKENRALQSRMKKLESKKR